MGTLELVIVAICMTGSAAALYFALRHAIEKVLVNQEDIKGQFSSLKSSHYTLRDDLKTEVTNLRVSASEDKMRHETLITEVRSLTSEMRSLTNSINTLVQQNAGHEHILRDIAKEQGK